MLHKLQSMLAVAETPTVSRRGFLMGAAATGAGLAIGFRPLGAKAAEGSAAINPMQAYIEIAKDGSVTILSSQFDMGQGSYHGIATLVAEELPFDWTKMDVIGAAGDVKLYGNAAWGGAFQGTGGSTSMTSSWMRYRQAGAAARIMLTEAAAKAWGVPAGEIAMADGMLTHAASGNSESIGAFAEAAAGMPVPADPPLKAKADWTVIGDPDLKRYDRVAKTKGEQEFTLDVYPDGVLTAVMIHPPKFGATVKSFDAAEAKKIDGVRDVVAIHRGVAVVAKDMWTAIKGRDAVTVDWDFSKAETRSSDAIMAEYRDLAAQPPKGIARNDGDVDGALANAATVIEATYEFPYLAHAALEPLNAVARMNADGTLEVWGGHQMPGIYTQVAAQIAGVDPSKIKMHVMKTGGGFGRRGVPDADVVSEAVAIGAATGWNAPIKVQWTRENDMRGGRYRPAYVHKLKAGLDADGKLVAWDDHIVGQAILISTGLTAFGVKDGVDSTSVEGAVNLPYAVPNVKVGSTNTENPIPVLWWRSVGSTQNAYATEVFLDEVIEAAGADPVQFRLDLLKDKPRHARVLKLAAEKAGWGKDLPEGRVHGVAVHESFSSFVAEVAEVSVDGEEIRVHKVVAAVDCGTVVNPDTVKAQIEGGIGFGLGAVMGEEITLTDGAVDQGNYDTYTPLRMDAMPEVEVHIVENDGPPTGVGEPGVPPIGPAVANGVFRASGRRIRVLPFTKGMTA